MSEEEQDVTRRYWRAAISCLPTAEKRDAAWAFYVERFAGQEGDLLSGLILLLEAHNSLLLTVPAKFEQEVLSPMKQLAVSLRKEMDKARELQSNAVATLEQAAELSKEVAISNSEASAKMATTIQSAFASPECGQFQEKLADEMEKQALIPLETAIGELRRSTVEVGEATKAARDSVAAWRKIAFKPLMFEIFLGVFIIFLVAFLCVASSMRNHYREAIASNSVLIKDNDKVAEELHTLGMPIQAAQVSEKGKAVKGTYAIVVENALNASFDSNTKRGVIYFKSPRSEAEIAAIREKLAKMPAGIRE